MLRGWLSLRLIPLSLAITIDNLAAELTLVTERNRAELIMGHYLAVVHQERQEPLERSLEDVR